MICDHCQRAIATGAEGQKMIVEYTQPDATARVFGYLMPAGPLAKATGRITRGWHHKCYHVVRKRELRLNEQHARADLEAVQAARAADVGHVEAPQRDWRHQSVVDI